MSLVISDNYYYNILQKQYLSRLNQFNSKTQSHIKTAIRLAVSAGYQEGLKAAQKKIASMNVTKFRYNNDSDDLEYPYQENTTYK